MVSAVLRAALLPAAVPPALPIYCPPAPRKQPPSTLHPNPAPEAATLTLAQPARVGAALRLTDALGRTVWSAPVATGQTVASVPLVGQPAGLYLLHLTGPDGATATWKLTHE